MAFTRHLHDMQTPEWEKAYIDYSRLKAALGAIRANTPRRVDLSHSSANHDIDHDHTHHSTSKRKETYYDFNIQAMTSAYLNRENSLGATRSGMSYQETPSFGVRLPGFAIRGTGIDLNKESPQISVPQIIHHSPIVSAFPKDSGASTLSPLAMIRSSLPAAHVKFFDILDAELDKVATFYADKEENMSEYSRVLKRQLRELEKHRQMFYESKAQSSSQSWAKRAYLSVTPVFSSLIRRIVGRNKRPQEPRHSRGVIRSSASYYGAWIMSEAAERGVAKGPEANGSTRPPPKFSYGGKVYPFDPHEYGNAKRRLRKAVIEHYRGLEMLSDYRALNLTGFDKLLRRYGKIAKISILDVYMKEKIEPSAFASDTVVNCMIEETEQLFAAYFEHGNKKKASRLLRFELATKTQHSSMLRTGLCLGITLCATTGGYYFSSQEQTRNSLTSWNIFLFVYSILATPVLLALLIGLNIQVWTLAKINYTFIFKLDARSRLDYHEYFEFPSFLLCTLACAFWLTFAQIGPPMLWPLLWFILTLVFMLNPIHSIMYGNARWWTTKKLAKLGASGVWTIEFVDLWLGDQMCSLVYFFTNMFFVGCFYTHTFPKDLQHAVTQYLSFPVNATLLESSASQTAIQNLNILSSAYNPGAQEAWATCGAGQNWKLYAFIGLLPFIIRFVQCVRRYWDSKLPTQLLNAGKYGAGMVYYIFYFNWRHQENSLTDKSYIYWCLAAVTYSLYGCAWDFFVDWSMCKPYARYPLLRPELGYKTHIPFYYLAMLFNLISRFNWLLYIFCRNLNFEACAFIDAVLEIVRRVVWNFYRLENKHVSNVDMYRATRDVPLPYHFDPRDSEEVNAARLQLKKRMARLS
ncbi:EXS family-domain-containing protein [Chiua virens]|nr:EXS family-domain-containing protein [Chiua virens]